MMKVGRNDLCPCGSGEKYKKCCGKNNTVVSMEHLIEKELYDIQGDIVQFAMQNYQEEIDEYLEKCFEEFDIPDEAMELYYFFCCIWFITSVDLMGRTIMSEYMDLHIHQFKRQRIKDILQSWRNVNPSVFKIQKQIEKDYVVVQDIFTKKVKKVKVLETDHIVESEGILIGIILPVGEESIFFTTFLDIPASESERIEEGVIDLFRQSGEENSVYFMASNFPEVLDYFLFGHAEVSTDDLEWLSPKQKEVALAYQEHMEIYQIDNTVTDLGVFLWHKYCMRKNPSIKKTAVYEAALVYLIDSLLPFGGYLTQKEIAEDFGVSRSSISSKFKEFERVLSNEIEELQEKLVDSKIDFEDIYGQDVFDFLNDDSIFVKDESENSFIHPRISMERGLLELEREMKNQQFDSIDEVNEWMSKRLNSKGSSKKQLSNKEKAQDLLYDAHETTGTKRKQLAVKALNVYPNSPDAYNILAEFEIDPEEQRKLYLKGIDAGEKELGSEFFNENKGHFWGIVSTRPYMRAKYNYGQLLQDIGNLDGAITQFEELLELNPMDNQGVRYDLFIAYVESNVLQKAEALLNEYNEEITAHGAYNRVLLEYLQNGPTSKAKKLLKNAMKNNPYVVDYLLQKKKLPLLSPATYGLGDESEAIIYSEQHIDLWRENALLIEWLKKSR